MQLGVPYKQSGQGTYRWREEFKMRIKTQTTLLRRYFTASMWNHAPGI